MQKTVLILGASGVVGAAAVEQFLEEGANVIAVSRRLPEIRSKKPFKHLSVDLRDAEASRAAFSGMTDVTHVVYTAVYEKPGLIAGWSDPEQMQTNLEMLRNVMEPLAAAAKGLRHVVTLQGTKAYGIHLHPMPIPARERALRDDHANFYWLQEDYIKAKSAEIGFDYTILRPQLIIGAPYGVVMNLAPVIGAYAAICKEEGEAFSFPGGPHMSGKPSTRASSPRSSRGPVKPRPRTPSTSTSPMATCSNGATSGQPWPICVASKLGPINPARLRNSLNPNRTSGTVSSKSTASAKSRSPNCSANPIIMQTSASPMGQKVRRRLHSSVR